MGIMSLKRAITEALILVHGTNEWKSSNALAPCAAVQGFVSAAASAATAMT